MREVILRPDAEVDIEDTADYTVEQWGHEQARKYVTELRRAIEQLGTTALRHPLYHEVYPGLRRKRSGMHHIYYLTTDDSVDVLNVIHVSRDPGRHLRTENWGNLVGKKR
jgi:toxin ParE1/3/4